MSSIDTASASALSQPRRHFFRTAAAALAAMQLTSKVNAGATPPRQTGLTSLEPVQSIVAGDLNVAYVDLGPKHGSAVILLHGWPYDIHSFAEVAPALAEKG